MRGVRGLNIGEAFLMHRLDDVQRDAKSLMEMEFVKEHGNPVLLARLIKAGDLKRKVPKRPEPPAEGEELDNETKKVKAYSRTQNVSPETGGGTMFLIKPSELTDAVSDPSILMDRKLERERYVPLCLSPTSPKKSPIKLGRSTSADVVVNDYTVSKEHAWFAAMYFPDRAPRYLFMDRGSTNGTFVGGVKVPANSRMEVKSGDKVVVGRMAFVFLNPQDFYKYLRGTLTNQYVIESLLDEQD